MKTKLLFLFLLFASLAITATAQVRQQNQRQHQGSGNHFRQGKITKGEAFLLHRQKQHIRHDFRIAKRNDGKIGPLERKHLKREMKQYKRQRFVAAHNRRNRG
jgi:hypothetical protein